MVLPMLMLFMTGIATFGIVLNQYSTLTEATNVAGRYLAVLRGNTTDPCAATVSAFESAAPGFTASKLTFSFVLNGTTYNGTSCSSTSTTSGAAGNLVEAGTAQLSVSYPCSMAVFGANYAPSCSLKTQITELVQ
jgi:hypothetical protein